MNIRERLELELDECKKVNARSRERATHAARTYLTRRLAQLDRHFTRHAFGWLPPTAYAVGLRVTPPVWGYHNVGQLLPLLTQRFPRVQSYQGLQSVCVDLDMTAGRIGREFGYVAPVLSPRAEAWCVDLLMLPADPIRVRQRD